MTRNPLTDLAALGDYLREQRQNARLSLRQLSELAGVSNPYLSQIERGLKRPSAEILQQLAKGLEVSAETLYVKAGILEEHPTASAPAVDVRRAIAADPALTSRQKTTLLEVYESFVGATAPTEDQPPASAPAGRAGRASRKASTAKTTGRTGTRTASSARRTSTTRTTTKPTR